MTTEIFLNGPIGAFGVDAETVRWELEKASDDITVRINSVGGSYSDGPAIYTYLAEYDGRVVTQVDGIAYSMAAMILQAGATRRMASNAVLMVHGAQGEVQGDAEKMRQTAADLERHTEALKSAFLAKKIPADRVEGWLDGGNHFFTAEEALEAGLIDEITEPVNLSAALANVPADIAHPSYLAGYFPKPKPDTKMTQQNDQKQNQPIDVTAVAKGVDQNYQRGSEAGAAAELKRQREIRAKFDNPMFQSSMFAPGLFDELRDQCLDNPAVTPERATDLLFDMMSATLGTQPLNANTPAVPRFAGVPVVGGHPNGASPGPAGAFQNAYPGEDVLDKFMDGAGLALEARAQGRALGEYLPKDDKERVKVMENVNPFLPMSVYELARHYLDITGVSRRIDPAKLSSREGVIGQALIADVRAAGAIGHSSSDFQYLLENVANKSMMRGWEEAGETWSAWARIGNLPDFKEGSRVNISTFGDLDEVGENAEYRYGTFDDLKETIILATYGKLFSISRQALANDDLDALGRAPMRMGRAAARTVGNLAYTVLISNPVLKQDSKEVFHADHNNIGTAALPDVAPGGSLDQAFTAMALQTDPAGNVLNISPRHLLVPKALEISSASMLADATFFYDSAAQMRANPFQNRLTVTADARLDVDSATQWYLLADQNGTDTIEVAFRNGEQRPFLDSKEGWNIDGIEYKVRIDAGAAPLDFRTMFRNAGA